MFTNDAIRTAIERTGDSPVATIQRVDAGQNHSYVVALADGSVRFLKVGTRFPDAFPAEPRTMTAVRRETDVPVPRVCATGRDPLGYPFAVYEHVPDAGYDWVRDLPETTARRLCREAGGHLASLHRWEFHSFGRVGPQDGGLGVVESRPYREMLAGSLDRQLDQLRAGRFADLCPALDEHGHRVLDAVDDDQISPALVHGDYRLDNLCLDPGADTVVAAVLDWELPTAADPLWDALMSLSLLTDGYGIAPALRRSLRVAFWGGYGNRPPCSPRWHCYELLARMRLARHLSTEMDGHPRPAIKERAGEHREAFDTLLDGTSYLRS